MRGKGRQRKGRVTVKWESIGKVMVGRMRGKKRSRKRKVFVGECRSEGANDLHTRTCDLEWHKLTSLREREAITKIRGVTLKRRIS